MKYVYYIFLNQNNHQSNTHFIYFTVHFVDLKYKIIHHASFSTQWKLNSTSKLNQCRKKHVLKKEILSMLVNNYFLAIQTNMSAFTA